MITQGSAPYRRPVARARGALHLVADAETEVCREKGYEQVLAGLQARLRSAIEACPSEANGRGHGPDPATLRRQLDEFATLLDELQGVLVPSIHRLRQWDGERQVLRRILGRLMAELAASRLNEKHSRYLATHDPLTELPNRGHFYQRLEEALRPRTGFTRPLAVLYVDLDGFKSLNDTHGHRAGDEFLRIAACRLAHAVRAGDVVCRLGGDEFACLLADLADRRRISRIAAKMFTAVSQPSRVGEAVLKTRPSIGIAMSPGDGLTADILLHRADVAMYQAKRRGCRYAFAANAP